MKKSILSIFLVFIAAQSIAFSATMFDPSLKWKSIKTEHFWIHYHQGLEDEAKRLTVIAEKVHTQLTGTIDWEPALRTDVILVDNMFTANGFATPFPFNRIQIYLTRPEPDSVLNNFKDWMELVFIHEYTHILNMDTAHGIPSCIRMGFGRYCFPNAFLPIWILEGNAVFHESAYSKYGRNNSTYTDMVLRTEVYSDNLKSLAEASTFPRRWPTGRVPYLYGGLFVEYLEKKYGKGSMADFFIEHSYNFVPFSEQIFSYPNHSLITSDQKIFNETFPNLWDEWQEFIKLKYKNQISKIKEEGLTIYRQITKSGYKTSLPKFSSDGESIFFIRLTNYNQSALMRYSQKDNEQSVLCRVNNPNSISTTINGEILLSDAEYYRSFSIYNEAFKYSNGYNILTKRLRGSYIDVAKNGEKVVFVKKDRDKYSIILSNYNFDKFEPIIDNSDIQISYTKFSPDTKKLVFTIKDRMGYADLAVLDIAEQKITRLMKDEFNDIEPAWHPDGKRIVFSSDRSGIYNLYEYNLENGTISKITNLVGGAFSPDISPDAKTIVFASYNMSGFDISTMKYPEKTISSQKGNTSLLLFDFFDAEAEKPQPEEKIKSESYNLWNSFFPPFWFPVFASSEVYDDKYQTLLGVMALGTDTLYQHSYFLTCYAYSFEKRANIDFSYMISRFYPNIYIEYKNNNLFYGDDEFPWEDDNKWALKRSTEQSGMLGILFPFIYFQSYHSFSLSYKFEKSYEDYYMPGSGTSKDNDLLARIRAKYYYNNTGNYAYSISPEDGRIFYIISDSYNEYIGSDLTLYKVRGEYSEYLPSFIGRNNVIMLRVRGGATFNSPSDYKRYTLGRFEKGHIGSIRTGDEEFGLRGYPSGVIYGSRIATGTVEYRFPVIQTELGYGTFPLMLRDIWFNVFYDYGNVWDNEPVLKDFKSSAGIELNMRITAGYNVSLFGYIGYARGFNENGEDQIYFAVSTIFEGALKNNYKWLDYL